MSNLTSFSNCGDTKAQQQTKQVLKFFRNHVTTTVISKLLRGKYKNLFMQHQTSANFIIAC